VRVYILKRLIQIVPTIIMITFVVFLMIVLLRPQGLFGRSAERA